MMVQSRRAGWLVAASCVLVLASAGIAQAQLGALISPGRLSRAHAQLEGIAGCQSCHEPGQGVTATKCLGCHEPVAERITRRFGVHARVAGDCVACHVEHAGVDGELRPFDTQAFDHAVVTGFPLDGLHQNLQGGCAACHTERSYLTVTAGCASCHTDPHEGSLGQACASCHSTATAFTELSPAFSHALTEFPLRGAHEAVACASCHPSPVFEPIDVSSCATCHEDPHRPALGATCTSCHTEASWRTEAVDHSRTDFPLRGLHASVECVACHKESAVKVQPKADTCGTCHEDVHRGSFAGQDCAACHTETGFAGAPFDHTVTTFPLTGSHAPLACSACHEESPLLVSSRARASAMVDFTGLETSCASCHADPHQEELGLACESCHSTETFELSRYTHADPTSFFEGQHTDVSCDGCHVPSETIAPVRTGATLPVVSFTSASEACATCHRDVHLGQLGASCESCHSLEAPLFAVADFAHSKTAFALEGSHAEIDCQACHKVETGVFPAGEGTAVRLKGVARECRACHQDVHLGQLNAACETCHDASRFTIENYTHQRGSLDGFFSGSHLRTACESCHQPVTGTFPSGHGTAVRFQTDTSCISCHEDRHRGSLGSRCAECHRP